MEMCEGLLDVLVLVLVPSPQHSVCACVSVWKEHIWMPDCRRVTSPNSNSNSLCDITAKCKQQQQQHGIDFGIRLMASVWKMLINGS